MSENLTIRERKLIALLVEGRSITAACAEIGLSRETAHRWMREKAFQEGLTEAASNSLGELSRRLTGLGELAASTIESVIQDETSPAGARLKGAELIISNILKLRETLDLEQRITNLEERIR